MDTSNFEVDHPLYNKETKGCLGLLKSETGSKLISEVIALRAKTYSILLHDGSTQCGTKGIARAEKRLLRHEHFRRTLLEGYTHTFTQSSICNIRGQIAT